MQETLLDGFSIAGSGTKEVCLRFETALGYAKGGGELASLSSAIRTDSAGGYDRDDVAARVAALAVDIGLLYLA